MQFLAPISKRNSKEPSGPAATTMKLVFLLFALALISLLRICDSKAQDYPSKPVRIVVNMPAGGGVDAAARLVGQKLSVVWNQPVVIENRGGAGGMLGADAAAKAAPDGYTLLVAYSGMAMMPNLYNNVPFDVQKGLIPISMIYSSFVVLVTNGNLPVTSVRELVALATSKPINYGHNGVGATLHLTMELFKKAAGIEMTPIPYRGGAPIVNALMTGEVGAAFTGPAPVLAQIQAGKLRALAVARRARSPVLPSVPTMAEAGIQDTDIILPEWVGIFAPAGTPRDIVNQVQREVAKAINSPDVRTAMFASAMEPVGNSQEEFEKIYNANLKQFSRVAATLHIEKQ